MNDSTRETNRILSNDDPSNVNCSSIVQEKRIVFCRKMVQELPVPRINFELLRIDLRILTEQLAFCCIIGDAEHLKIDVTDRDHCFIGSY